MFWSKKKTEELTVSQQVDVAIKKLANDLNMDTNSVANSGIRGRIAAAISGGYDGADTMHNVFLDYGYPETLTFSMLWNMYRRFGIANSVVELPIETTWMDFPTIESTETFVNEIEELNTELKLWTRIKGLDSRQRVGRYAGMFMRVRDGKKPDQPLEGSLNGIGALVEMVPLYESQLSVQETNTDPTDDNFGQPTMYQFVSSVAGNRNEKAGSSFSIHPSRIVIAAEDADDGSIYGISSLEAPYNSLMDLRKIIGAGGEGFYKNAAQSILFDLKNPASAKVNAPLLEKFNESYDEFSRNRVRRSMWTPGMDANTLDSNLIGSQEFFDGALNDVAAGAKIPATILIGKQTGRLASSEDSRHFLSIMNSRRGGFATDTIRAILDWCIDHGIISSADYEVEWDDLLTLSDEQKLGNAKTMSETNKSQFNGGGSPVFTGDEIREVAGYDEPIEELDLPDEEVEEEDIDLDLEPDEDDGPIAEE